MKLTDEQRSFYNENGYLLVDKVVPAEICDAIAKAADRLASPQFTPLQSPHRKAQEFMDIVRSPQVLEVLDSLRNKRKIPINTTFVFAKPGNPFENGSAPHQDWNGAKGPVDSYIIAGIAIDGADGTNGGMMVYPGSHKLGILPYDDRSAFEDYASDPNAPVKPLGRPTEVPAGLERVQLSYDKGSMIILHTLMIHHCHKNMNPDRWRRHLYIDLIEDGDPFWPGWRSRRELIDRP